MILLWKSKSLRFFVVILVVSTTLVPPIAFCNYCHVKVNETWPESVFVPVNSSVTLNCSVPFDAESNTFWEIDLPNDDDVRTLRFITIIENSTLNSHGVHALPSVRDQESGMLTLKLLINDTEQNNQTKVYCGRGASSKLTSLSVFKPIALSLEAVIINKSTINISWCQDLAPSDVFSLTVSHGARSYAMALRDPFYLFTAPMPENAQPCEMYDFSVTTVHNYAGATYTGAGCNISGSIFVMLPLLPKILMLETSLRHSLSKISSKYVLIVTFESTNSCKQNALLDYMLEVKGPSSNGLNHSVSPGIENVIYNLTENTIYSFQVFVSNNIGVVATRRRQFNTTDVQNVTVTLIDNMSLIVIHCDFIAGYDAEGCMVVLTDEFDNKTRIFNVTNACKMDIFNNTELLMFHRVISYDIKFDGSVGDLEVPGVIVYSNDHKSVTMSVSCPSTGTNTLVTNTIAEKLNTHIILGSSLAGVLSTILVCVTVILAIVIYCKKKRSKKFLIAVQPIKVNFNTSCSELVQCAESDEELQKHAGEILYDQPVKGIKRYSGDGVEHAKTKHNKDFKNTIVYDREMNSYAELVEENHHYHTLEPQKPHEGAKLKPDLDAPALPLPYNPPSPSQDPPLPEYQEIGALLEAKSKKRKEETVCDEVMNDLYQPSTSQSQPEESHTQAQT